MLGDICWNPKNIGIVYTVFLCLKLTTITQLNFLFVLYFWFSYCRCLKKLLMKWVQFINNYQKSTLGRPMKRQFILSLVFYLLRRHINILTGKGFNVLNEYASRCVRLSPQEEGCTSSSWGDCKMCTSGSIASSKRLPTEVNESGAIAKIRISVENDAVKHLKVFRLISSEMPISLLILSW